MNTLVIFNKILILIFIESILKVFRLPVFDAVELNAGTMLKNGG